MIQITERIWIGDSNDEQAADVRAYGITSILNVANDLQPTRGWDDGIEYCQVGLIDGPGNPLSMYCAAILALRTLAGRHKVLICCHTGSRSVAVAAMYRRAIDGPSWPGDWEIGWDGIARQFLSRAKMVLPVPAEAHREAFDRMCWRSIAGMMKD